MKLKCLCRLVRHALFDSSLFRCVAGFRCHTLGNRTSAHRGEPNMRGATPPRTLDMQTHHSEGPSCIRLLESEPADPKTTSPSNDDSLHKAKRILWTAHTAAQLSLYLLTLLLACEIYPPTTEPRPIQGLLLWLLLWLPLCSALWLGTIFAGVVLSSDSENFLSNATAQTPPDSGTKNL